MAETLEQEMARIGDAPSDNPRDRLRHVLRVYGDTEDSEVLVTATKNVYGDQVWTGLTWGDLRTIAGWVGASDA